MKIAVITGRYALSGVPLAQERFSHALARRGHDVDFLIGMVNEGYRAPVAKDFRTVVLARARVSLMLIPIARYLRKENPDVVFSAGDHLNAIVLLAALLAGSKAKISCSSRVTPFDTYSDVPFSKGWLLKGVMRAVMRRANALTCVSKDMVVQYQEVFENAPHRCVYNLVDDQPSRLRMTESVDEPWLLDGCSPTLIAGGALQPWKGFVDLIRAMRHIPASVGARLILLGDGPLRDELQALIGQLGLHDRVKLLGYVENPLKYFSRANVFVLSSHVEGLPNVLVEAMMCGCTPVATDCPTGPREVLQDGKFGYLVPVGDEMAIAAAIVKAIEAPVPPAKLLEAVRPFSETTVLAQHFSMLGITHPSPELGDG